MAEPLLLPLANIEFKAVVRTIDRAHGTAATDSLLADLGVDRSFGATDEGPSRDFVPASLAAAAARHLEMATIGFDMADLADMAADLGIYGYAMLAASTVSEMLRIGLRFNTRYARTTGYQIVQGGDASRVEFWARGLPPDLAVIQTEMMMPSMWRFMVQLRPEIANGELTTVELSYPAPTHSAVYEDFYGVPALFDQPTSSFVLALGTLSQPISATSAIAHKVLTSQSSRTLNELGADLGIVDAVRSELLTRTGRRWPTLESVAVSLAMSARTLHRRLAARGTSFNEVSMSVRMALAREYLETTELDNAEIARLLGYSHPPAFYRAFKEWHGVAPADARRSSGP